MRINGEPGSPQWGEVVRVNHDRGRCAAPATAVICCALDVEYAAVMSCLDELRDEPVEQRGTRYELGHFQGDHARWNIALALAGRENAAAGIQVERAISPPLPTSFRMVQQAHAVVRVTLREFRRMVTVARLPSRVRTNGCRTPGSVLAGSGAPGRGGVENTGGAAPCTVEHEGFG
ncbi:hypothetical protein [Actinophytocola xinjiangensis]|uniref:hypothetical protein n=1 Tax=Actinophytocola xinjiangensis TaxID=485602 RepID=UPI000ADC2E58|nr:hypothetical protein [Actinophytocola xinjiangensis]